MLCALCIASSHAWPLSIRFDFARAMQGATVVAWVEVERGEVVPASTKFGCGAKYRARVIKSLKGSSDGAYIEFGPFLGHEIGGQYFVFLESRERVVARTPVGDPPPVFNAVPYLAECRATLPPYLETSEGVGTLHLKTGDLVGYRPAISIGSPPYQLPADIPGARAPGGSRIGEQFYGTVQIEPEAFVQFLNSLPREAK